MNIRVGIDAISVYVPKLYIDIEGEWAQTRFSKMRANSAKEFADKVIKGIGIEQMAVPDAHEDPVTMAAMAVCDLIEKTKIDPAEICFLGVGTETTVDQSKSMSSYVLGLVEQYFDRKMTECRTPQYTFACAGAMYALESALNLFRSAENSGKYAIIIATDIARYDLFSPGESTQGAGAVAMLVCVNPRLLTMDPKVLGVASKNERDFFRPNWRSTAVVDGKYSTQVYLDLMEQAFSTYCARLHKQGAASNKKLSNLVDYLVCHVPFPKMAEYVGARFLPKIYEELASEFELTVAKQTQEGVLKKDLEKLLRSSLQFKTLFAAHMEPSLKFSKFIGNMYSGSMFLALMSLLENLQDSELSNKRVLLGSYGSGATSLVTSGVIEPTFREAIAQFSITNLIAKERRKGISVNQYEYLHALTDVSYVNSQAVSNFPRKSILEPRSEFALTKLGTEEHNFGFRYYEFIK